MQNLINDIAEIVADYRHDDKSCPPTDDKRVTKWISQFDSDDREFLLTELRHVLKKRYLSKSVAIKRLESLFEDLTEIYKCANVREFLLQTHFLCLQEEGKSQVALLEFVDQIIQKEHSISLSDCGVNGTHHFLYIDDLLATGTTLKIDIGNWLDEEDPSGMRHIDYLHETHKKLIIVHLFSHSWGYSNVQHIWNNKYNSMTSEVIDSYCFEKIENNFNMKNPYFQKPKYDIVCPISDGQPKFVTEYLASLDGLSPYMRYEERAFRSRGLPEKEEFFTSPDNRIRYENILLHKGIELLNRATIKEQRLRPLGWTVKTHKTFGLGAQVFTWRNIANNTPLVFWWGAGWTPLFENKRQPK